MVEVSGSKILTVIAEGGGMRRILGRFPRTRSQAAAERLRRAWFGIVGCWFVLGVSGCGSGPLPPPPSSSPPTPTVQPTVVPARVSSVPPKAKSIAPQAESSTTVASAPSEATTPTANPIAPSSTLQPGPPATMGQPVKGPEAAGNFIMALCRDLDGNVWVGTEDKGVLRGTPNGKWTQFTTKDGLGDDNGYAICCDRLGRVWVGQLNHGVAVFNGESWRTYDVLDGPIGERVFDIACSPVDGDVWIATSAGLTRYSESAGRWTNFTRADGLPSDQPNALAVADDGTLYVGTQCDGLAIGKSQDNYATWQLVKGDLIEAKYRQPQGAGLPSSQINDVLVARDGTVCVATVLGLAKSKNAGQSWEYLRGRDYADKVKGRAEPPPKTWSPLPKEKLAALLPEDYVTCLAEDAAGRIWLGFRQQGFGVIDPKSGASFHGTKETAKLNDTFIAALLPDETGRALIGGYGGGVLSLKEVVLESSAKRAATAGSKSVAPRNEMSVPVHPMVTAPASLAELRSLMDQLESLKPVPPESSGLFLGDDWKTQGDWVGRLGRQDAVLCAMDSPLNDYLGTNTHYFSRATVGPHALKGEALRHWCHWVNTDNRRSLYNPTIGHRREAEWDDHGEVYPMSHEGPDIWVEITVPQGVHRVSLYFFNPNGHEGHNRFRDYLIELKPYHAQPRVADKQRALATARVSQFWGGCHKQFAVRGPGKYWLKLDRNGSFNTITSGVMIDLMAGWKWPFDDMALSAMGNLQYRPPKIPALSAETSLELRAARELHDALPNALLRLGGAERHRELSLIALRTALNFDPPPELVANWRWQLRLWSSEERDEFDAVMRRAWQAHLDLNPQLKAKYAKK